jgi:hypothetical protein
MGRKPKALRLSQTKELLTDYQAIGLTEDYRYRFIHDMISKLGCDKGLSTKQRKWLDSLITEGVPEPQGDPELIKKITSASELDGMQHRMHILCDFAGRLMRGWELSEKQEKFLHVMLVEAEKIQVHGRWRPTPTMIKDLEIAIAICEAKNDWYWQHRPGTAKAHHKVVSWLSWSYITAARAEITASGGGEFEPAMEPQIDEWACEKLLNACNKQLGELEEPRHAEGSICWHRLPTRESQCVLIAGPPFVENGVIAYPCLVNGALVNVATERLKKRR